jgi:NAD(P)-dependent dehydrogenase (short-subunit alcohol dehydrogenase family)
MHISSGAAHKSIAGWGAYCVSKAALYRMWACLKEELQAHQIDIASVRPGVVDTEMQNTIRQATHPAFVQRPYFENLKATNQLISAEEVAHYIFTLFVHTPAPLFSEHEWDIRDSEHE